MEERFKKKDIDSVSNSDSIDSEYVNKRKTSKHKEKKKKISNQGSLK